MPKMRFLSILNPKIRAPVLLNLFYLFSPTRLISSIKQEHSCKILYMYKSYQIDFYDKTPKIRKEHIL